MPTLSKLEQGHAVTLTAAKIRTEVARAEKLEFDLEIMRGNYLPAKEVEQALVEYTRKIRDAWQNFVPRNSAIIASELSVDEHICGVVLDKYIKQQLEELSEQIQAI